MGLFEKKSRDYMNQIRCDESNYLIWKWQPSNHDADPNRENAIRWGSSIRVKDGEAAILVYSQANGSYQDFIQGPYDGILETLNLPILADLVGLAYNGGSPFQAEVYFVNLAHIIQVKFGVPYFDVYDPRFPDFGVPVAVRGTITFKIADIKEFVRLNRLRAFNVEDFQKQIRDTVNRYVKDRVANAPAVHSIPVIQIENKTSFINDEIEYDLATRLREDFGVEVSGIDIAAIEIKKDSDAYAQLLAVTKGVTASTIQAQTDANIQQMRDKQHADAEHYAETLRIQREEAQYAQRKQTQTSHFAAYQTEAQTQVGMAAAEALGKASTRGSLGQAGGLDPATMMTGMAIGGTIGQNLSKTMNEILDTPNSPIEMPPPIPQTAPVAYHIAIDGQAAGPFTIPAMKKMILNGTLSASSLVWKSGMLQWATAETIPELSDILNCETELPPPIQ